MIVARVKPGKVFEIELETGIKQRYPGHTVEITVEKFKSNVDKLEYVSGDLNEKTAKEEPKELEEPKPLKKEKKK